MRNYTIIADKARCLEAWLDREWNQMKEQKLAVEPDKRPEEKAGECFNEMSHL